MTLDAERVVEAAGALLDHLDEVRDRPDWFEPALRERLAEGPGETLFALLDSAEGVLAWLAARLGVPVDELHRWLSDHGYMTAGIDVGDDEPHPTHAEPPDHGGEEGDFVPANGEPPGPPSDRGLDEVEANGGPVSPGAAPTDRRILARVSDVSDPASPHLVEKAFRAGAPHEIAVAVGPADAAWIAADRRFPDEQLPDDRQLHRLTVVLSFGATTQADVVDLPPHGTSTTCRFAVTVGSGPDPVEARIIVGFRNRVLQTAVLRGWVLSDPEAAPAGSAIDLSVEAMPRPAMSELDERKPFGAALVVSDDAGGKTAVGLGSDRMSRFDLDEIAPAIEPLTLILSRIADDPDALGPALDSPGSVALLRDLAVQGVELYEHLGKQVVEELAGDDLDRLQVVSTNPRTFVPIEFVYDLPPPSPKAGLCPKWKTALRTGRCDHADLRLDTEGLAGLVCPLGFWCLRKVIERHVADRADLGPAGTFAVRSDPSAERSSLAPFAGGLFAASERVTKALAGGVLRAMSTATGKHAEQVSTWSDWAAAVKARRPALLVLLSHTADDAAPVALEIGAEGERRAAAQITDRFVLAGEASAPPVVLLLGCDTAVNELGFQTFVAQFREQGAAVVVGTIVSVLGRNAAPVAQALVRDLATASRSKRASATTFGEVMAASRRKLLARGELTALCLTAYGDADWVLAPRPA